MSLDTDFNNHDSLNIGSRDGILCALALLVTVLEQSGCLKSGAFINVAQGALGMIEEQGEGAEEAQVFARLLDWLCSPFMLKGNDMQPAGIAQG